MFQEGTKKILIVEDDESILLALTLRLSKENFECLIAKDGEEGLAVALKEHPDLILLDLIMPKMDGLTMLDKLREDAWGKAADVIVLTNLTDPLAEQRTATQKVDVYLVKTDWQLEDVVAKIKKRLGILQ